MGSWGRCLVLPRDRRRAYGERFGSNGKCEHDERSPHFKGEWCDAENCTPDLPAGAMRSYDLEQDRMLDAEIDGPSTVAEPAPIALCATGSARHNPMYLGQRRRPETAACAVPDTLLLAAPTARTKLCRGSLGAGRRSGNFPSGGLLLRTNESWLKGRFFRRLQRMSRLFVNNALCPCSPR